MPTGFLNVTQQASNILSFTDSKELVQNTAQLSEGQSWAGVQSFPGDTASSSTSTGQVVVTGGMGVSGNIIAGTVYNAYWNDIADCLEVPIGTNLRPGLCYCFDGHKYYPSKKYLDDGIIGIHSDTAGFFMGHKENKLELRCAVKGFVLAYVDKEYPAGTPLTTFGENGMFEGFLTELKPKDLNKNYHKIVGFYWKAEYNENWGPNHLEAGQVIPVLGRHWVKVK